MARMTEIAGVKFNSVMYEANEWVLASEVAPYIKEAVKTSHNRQIMPVCACGKEAKYHVCSDYCFDVQRGRIGGQRKPA